MSADTPQNTRRTNRVRPREMLNVDLTPFERRCHVPGELLEISARTSPFPGGVGVFVRDNIAFRRLRADSFFHPWLIRRQTASGGVELHTRLLSIRKVFDDAAGVRLGFQFLGFTGFPDSPFTPAVHRRRHPRVFIEDRKFRVKVQIPGSTRKRPLEAVVSDAGRHGVGLTISDQTPWPGTTWGLFFHPWTVHFRDVEFQVEPEHVTRTRTGARIYIASPGAAVRALTEAG